MRKITFMGNMTDKNPLYLLEHVIVFVQPGVEDPVHLMPPPVDGNLVPTTQRQRESVDYGLMIPVRHTSLQVQLL